MDEIILTPEQEAEAERIGDNLKAAATVEVQRIARLLASKENRHLFGETEFPVRDAVHWIAARGMNAAACKTVVCQPLKESGMRWREHGTTGPSTDHCQVDGGETAKTSRHLRFFVKRFG